MAAAAAEAWFGSGGGALRRLGLVGTPHTAGSGSGPQRRALALGRALRGALFGHTGGRAAG